MVIDARGIREASEDRVWIEVAYKKAFPHLVAIFYNKEVETQKKGVDLYAKIENGTRVKIEEKVRGYSYDDLLLEDYSNYEQRTPGWARDITKISDYLAYILLPSRLVYIIYFPALRRIFIERYPEWSKVPYKFGKTFDQDNNLLYTTANIPVPIVYFPKDWRLKNWWTYRAT